MAKLVDDGYRVETVYAADGFGGGDVSGMNLSGDQLSIEREIELNNALNIIGIEEQTILFVLPDGRIRKSESSFKKMLVDVLEETRPAYIFTFNETGITNHSDHIAVGEFVSDIVVENGLDISLFKIAMSSTRLNAYNSIEGITDTNYKLSTSTPDEDIDLTVDVSLYSDVRVNAMSSHKTQFNATLVRIFTDFVSLAGYEELQIINEGSYINEITEKLK